MMLTAMVMATTRLGTLPRMFAVLKLTCMFVIVRLFPISLNQAVDLILNVLNLRGD